MNHLPLHIALLLTTPRTYKKGDWGGPSQAYIWAYYLGRQDIWSIVTVTEPQ